MMHGLITLFMTCYCFTVSNYKKAINSPVNRDLASVINNWNNSSKCSWNNKVIYVFARSNELLI